MRLNLSQRKSLGEYCGNLSIAWLAAGAIGPYVTKQTFADSWQIVSTSFLIAGILLLVMLFLIGGNKRL